MDSVSQLARGGITKSATHLDVNGRLVSPEPPPDLDFPPRHFPINLCARRHRRGKRFPDRHTRGIERHDCHGHAYTAIELEYAWAHADRGYRISDGSLSGAFRVLEGWRDVGRELQAEWDAEDVGAGRRVGASAAPE